MLLNIYPMVMFIFKKEEAGKDNKVSKESNDKNNCDHKAKFYIGYIVRRGERSETGDEDHRSIKKWWKSVSHNMLEIFFKLFTAGIFFVIEEKMDCIIH